MTSPGIDIGPHSYTYTYTHTSLVLRLFVLTPLAKFTSLLNLRALIFDLSHFAGLFAFICLFYMGTSFLFAPFFIYLHFLRNATRA